MSISPKIHLNNFIHQHPKISLFLAILLLGFFLTIIFTWPMIFKLTVFYSDESDYTLIGWIFWYNQFSFITGRIFSTTDYFNAFQFYPWPYSLAFSENLFLPSLLFSPIYWLTNQLVLSVNLYTFSTFILTFISSFYVFKKFLQDKYASIIAAAIFTFNPITAAHFPGHTHLLGKFFLPILFLGTINFFSKPSFKTSLVFGLVFTLNALTSINFFIISIPSTFLTALPFLAIKIYKLNFQYFKKLLLSSLAFLIFTPLFLHFILPYQAFSALEGAQRGVDESIFFSAEPLDWISPFPESLVYKAYVSFIDPKRIGFPKLNYSEHTLGLNLFPMLLFLIGLVYIRKQKLVTNNILLSSFILTLIGTFIFTFGPLSNGLKLPYYYFNDLTGLLNGIRVPTRFQFFFYIPFSLIAGLGFFITSKNIRLNKTIVFLLFLFFITLEGFNHWNFISDTSSLTENPPVFKEYRSFNFLKNTTTLHLPAYTKNPEKQIYYLNLAVLHDERLINGYSGYFPPEWVELMANIETDLNENNLKKLAALKVDFLILHKDHLEKNFTEKNKTKYPIMNQLIYFEDENYLVLDIKQSILTTKPCFLTKDIKVSLTPKSSLFGLKPTYFNQVKIVNTKDCYFTNILNDRYLETEFFINGKFYPMNLKMPAVLGPQEEALLK